MGKYLIGIDAGNTTSKVMIFNETGEIISSKTTASLRAKREHTGFEEFNVDELWALISKGIKELIAESEISAEQISGIGITSFGNGLVIVDEQGQTIANGAFSHDYRANAVVEGYKKNGNYEKINDVIKGTLYAGEPGPILRWYKENRRDVYDQIGSILMFKDYLIYKLTSIFATDANMVGGSALLDMEEVAYSEELMELLGIPEMYDKLPKLAYEPTEIIGRVTEEAAESTGLMAGTPVAAGMMDILACLVGAGGTDPGVVTCIAGTWCINETHSTEIIPNASSNMPYLTKGEYLNCSYTGASGANYEWFTKELGGTAKLRAQAENRSFYEVLDEEIRATHPSESSVLYFPYVAQPSVHVNAKAGFFNIDQSTSYSEMVRAVAEGIAFIHKYHVDFLKHSGLDVDLIRLTGGIAKSPVWVSIFTNVLNVPVESVDCSETGAHGAAIAAGIGSGVYQNYTDAFEKSVQLHPVSYPDPELAEEYARKYAEWTEVNELLLNYWEKNRLAAIAETV